MNDIDVVCCAECGVVRGASSLKMCKACMHARYCNAECQRNHWPTHKIECKKRAAELRDEALFKDPPAEDDCPICFLPMPINLICCVSLPPATISSVPIFDYAIANKELANKTTKNYYSCCGKSICGGCVHSFRKSGNHDKCPFCNSDRSSKTDVELVAEMIKRVAANDAGAMNALGSYYFHGPMLGLSQDEEKAMELWKQAAKLGSSDAYHHMGVCYDDGGDLKKAKFHYEAAAMAGHEDARFNLGLMDIDFEGKRERAIKNMTIAASAGHYKAMQILIKCFERDYVSRKSINSTLTAYNNLCVEMRSEARDAFILLKKETLGFGRG